MRGWLNYYGVADMKKKIDDLNKWLYHRIRMCIWKQWKETEDKDKKSAKDGSTKGLGMASRKQSQRILVCDSYDSGQFSNDKRKTDKQWLL